MFCNPIPLAHTALSPEQAIAYSHNRIFFQMLSQLYCILWINLSNMAKPGLTVPLAIFVKYKIFGKYTTYSLDTLQAFL